MGHEPYQPRYRHEPDRTYVLITSASSGKHNLRGQSFVLKCLIKARTTRETKHICNDWIVSRSANVKGESNWLGMLLRKNHGSIPLITWHQQKVRKMLQTFGSYCEVDITTRRHFSDLRRGPLCICNETSGYSRINLLMIGEVHNEPGCALSQSIEHLWSRPEFLRNLLYRFDFMQDFACNAQHLLTSWRNRS